MAQSSLGTIGKDTNMGKECKYGKMGQLTTENFLKELLTEKEFTNGLMDEHMMENG